MTTQLQLIIIIIIIIITLTSALDGVSGQHQAPAGLPPGERPGTHYTGDWVGPRAGLDGCGKSRLHMDSIPGTSSPQRVAIPTDLSGPQSVQLPAHLQLWPKRSESIALVSATTVAAEEQ